MKNIIAIFLAAVILVSACGCSRKGGMNEDTTDRVTTDTGTDIISGETTDSAEITDVDTTEAEITDKVNDGDGADTQASVAKVLASDFKKDHSGSAQEIAERLLENKAISFAGGAMAVEEGLLTGFDDTEIKGFKEGAMFSPMIGTIPFVGYVFVLKDDTDVTEFKKTLRDNANLRWNICTQAEEMVVESVETKVLFIMSPLTFEEGSAGNDNGVEGEDTTGMTKNNSTAADDSIAVK